MVEADLLLRPGVAVGVVVDVLAVLANDLLVVEDE